MDVEAGAMNVEESQAVAARFIEFLKTGRAEDGLFTDDVFVDFTLPAMALAGTGRGGGDRHAPSPVT